MNYYEHHIGDYAEATAHLSFVEDAAYSRLIRKYYANEGPLPADLRAVQRLICARSEEEREAVQIVLAEFFTLADDGYHNARCDEEIARYQEKQEKARNSANARWKKGKDHAGAADPALPPQSDGKPDAVPTESEGNANAPEEPCERINSECEGNAHQSPVTNTLPNGSYEREAHTRNPGGPTGITVPTDLQPDRATSASAATLNVDLQHELAKFVAHHEAAGTALADAKAWQAKFRKWVLDAHQYNTDRNRVTESRMQTDHSSRAADSAALGVGSQYREPSYQEAARAIRN